MLRIPPKGDFARLALRRTLRDVLIKGPAVKSALRCQSLLH